MKLLVESCEEIIIALISQKTIRWHGHLMILSKMRRSLLPLKARASSAKVRTLWAKAGAFARSLAVISKQLSTSTSMQSTTKRSGGKAANDYLDKLRGGVKAAPRRNVGGMSARRLHAVFHVAALQEGELRAQGDVAAPWGVLRREHAGVVDALFGRRAGSVYHGIL